MVCNKLKSYSGYSDPTTPNGLEDTYYDGERVFYQIADYSGDASWLDCAKASHNIYGNLYVINNWTTAQQGPPGYWLFPNGLYKSYSGGNQNSRGAFQVLLSNGNYVPATGYNVNGDPSAKPAVPGQADWSYMRETAYALNAVSFAPQFGIPLETPFTALTPAAPPLAGDHLGQTVGGRKAELEQLLLGQLSQSFVTKTAAYRKPFMVGLAAWSLIENYPDDPAVKSMLQIAADYMWQNMWIAHPVTYPQNPSFHYTDDPDPNGNGTYETPDLNNLISPMYYWLYKVTGDAKYIDEGDQIFNSGATFVDTLNGGKQFDQNYRWTFEGLHYRGN